MATMHTCTNKFILYHVNVVLESYHNSQQCFKKPDSKFGINQKISEVKNLLYWQSQQHVTTARFLKMGRNKSFRWKVCSSYYAVCGTWDPLFTGFYRQMVHPLGWGVLLIVSDSSNFELFHAELDSYPRKGHPYHTNRGFHERSNIRSNEHI